MAAGRQFQQELVEEWENLLVEERWQISRLVKLFGRNYIVIVQILKHGTSRFKLKNK